MQAHWIEHDRLFTGKKFECSNCGVESDAPCSRCPRCGADMTKTKYSPDFVDECEIMDILFH